MSNKIPNDPHILYSYVNTMLRDRFGSLEDFCRHYEVDIEELERKLEAAGYEYDEELNRFK